MTELTSLIVVEENPSPNPGGTGNFTLGENAGGNDGREDLAGGGGGGGAGGPGFGANSQSSPLPCLDGLLVVAVLLLHSLMQQF